MNIEIGEASFFRKCCAFRIAKAIIRKPKILILDRPNKWIRPFGVIEVEGNY